MVIIVMIMVSHDSGRLHLSHGLHATTTLVVPPRKRLRHTALTTGAMEAGDGMGDWRDQLYTWRGHLSLDTASGAGGGGGAAHAPSPTVVTSPTASGGGGEGGGEERKSVLLWSGTWVGSWQQVAGSESTLAWTGNTFTYRGPPVSEAVRYYRQLEHALTRR